MAVLYLVQVYLLMLQLGLLMGVGLASESASHASLYQEQPAMEVDAPTRFPSPSRHDPTHASNAVQVDIGLIANPSRVSDSERFQVLTNHFKLEKGTKLAYQQVKKSDKTWNVNFQTSWLTEFPRLVYSPARDGGFCKYCCMYDHISKGTLGVLVKSPFTRFSKAKGKDGILTKHVKTEYHQTASECAKAFIATFQIPSQESTHKFQRKGRGCQIRTCIFCRELLKPSSSSEDKGSCCVATRTMAQQMCSQTGEIS